MSTTLFLGAAYWQFDGFQIFVPDSSATRRLSGTMAVGFFATGGVIAIIYHVEVALAMLTQRTVRPQLQLRLLNYPGSVTLMSAIGSAAAAICLGTNG